MSDVTPLYGASPFTHPAWGQQPGETGAAFMAAEIYFDLGRSRTLQAAWNLYRRRLAEARAKSRKAAKSRKKPISPKDLPETRPSGAFKDWRQANRWEMRARLYDLEEDRVKREKFESERLQMSLDHARDLRKTREALMPVADSIAEALADEVQASLLAAELAEMSVLERIKTVAYLGRVMPTLISSERLVMGGSTENQNVNHTGSVETRQKEGPSDVERAAAAAIRKDPRLRAIAGLFDLTAPDGADESGGPG